MAFSVDAGNYEPASAASDGIPPMPDERFKRLHPRVRILMPCRLAWQERQVQVSGTTIDVAYGGVTVLLPGATVLAREEALIHIPDGIRLRARPVHVEERAGVRRVGFKIEAIESGEDQWKRLCYVPQW